MCRAKSLFHHHPHHYHSSSPSANRQWGTFRQASWGMSETNRYKSAQNWRSQATCRLRHVSRKVVGCGTAGWQKGWHWDSELRLWRGQLNQDIFVVQFPRWPPVQIVQLCLRLHCVVSTAFLPKSVDPPTAEYSCGQCFHLLISLNRVRFAGGGVQPSEWFFDPRVSVDLSSWGWVDSNPSVSVTC